MEHTLDIVYVRKKRTSLTLMILICSDIPMEDETRRREDIIIDLTPFMPSSSAYDIRRVAEKLF